jgi:hypothetical protein
MEGSPLVNLKIRLAYFSKRASKALSRTETSLAAPYLPHKRHVP